MKSSIQILTLIFLLYSCESSKKEEITQNCSVELASEQLNAITEFLETKDYSFNSRILNEDFTISYKDWVTFKEVEKITYQECKYIELNFTKNQPVNGNYYPKFKMFELCFDSNEKAKEYHTKFSQIIGQQEKNYGYVLTNRNRLLYVQTGVNRYGFIIKDLKKDFEKIIKNGS